MVKKRHLWIPSNYGYLAFFTPIIGLISFLYIRKATNKNYTISIRILQGLNWFFIVFPFAVILYIMSYFN